jgi:filamentous hemagglutinin
VASKLGGALDELSDQIRDSHPTGNADIDQALAQIVTTSVGTAVGAAAGGTSGAFTGYNVDRFNRQLHPTEEQRLRQLQQGKSPEEQYRLAAAECALTHCADGIPDSDSNKAMLQKMQNDGQGYTVQQEQLKNAGAFEGYGAVDRINDGLDRYQVSNRAVGAVQAVTSTAVAAEALGAGCASVVGCGLGTAVAVGSLDYAKAGFNQAVNGDVTSTYGEQALQALGMSPGGAALAYGALNLGAAAGSAVTANQTAKASAVTSTEASDAGKTASSVNKGNFTGGGAALGDDSQFVVGERQLPAKQGTLSGIPELPPANAPPDQVRAVNRQNETAQVLADHGLDVTQLPNTGRPGANPDLSINGEVADVYAPTSGNLQTVRDTVATKVSTQAPNVVINLADSPLSSTQVAQFLQRNPVAGMDSVILIKNGKVTVIGK